MKKLKSHLARGKFVVFLNGTSTLNKNNNNKRTLLTCKNLKSSII